MYAEWFGRSDQLQSMANSNPALIRTPSECRLGELCCALYEFYMASTSSLPLNPYIDLLHKLISFLYTVLWYYVSTRGIIPLL